MSINRDDLIEQIQESSAMLLEEKGYVSFVDVLMRMGKLTITTCGGSAECLVLSALSR